MGNKNNNKIKKSKTKVKKGSSDFYLEDYEIINTKFHRRLSDRIKFDSNIFIQNTKIDPLKIYTKEKTLGKGAFGEVHLVRHNVTGIIRAMKIIDKNSPALKDEELSDEEILNEINILKKIDHPNIMKIFEFYNTESTYYLIVEYCQGGDLNDFVNENELSEFQVIYIMYQILAAMNYCHKMKILHRDLKPANILIKKNDEGLCRVKICDFGTSAVFKKGEKQTETIGTLCYMAPEVINGEYNEKCDLWSCGVIMYILLTKKTPFIGRNDDQTALKILCNSYNEDLLNKYNKYTKDLLSKLLEKEPKKRISASDALNHIVFKKNRTKEILNEIPNEKIIQKFIQNLKNYKSDSVLRETTLAYLVHNYPDLDQVNDACKLFDQIDVNGNGKITKKELFLGLTALIDSDDSEQSQKDSDEIFINLDTDNNNYISYEEFIRAAIDKEIFLKDDILDFAFKYFDKDNSGEITIKELEMVFKDNIKSKDCKKELINILKEVDTNNDKVIDFEEFKKLMKNILN